MKNHIVFEGMSKKGRKFIVRYPVMDDLPELLSYINTLSAERTFISFQGEQLTLKEEKKYLEDSIKRMKKREGILLLVFCEGKLCGVSDVEMKERAEKHLGIFGLSIDKNFRGEGIGKAVMEAALNEAKKKIPQLKILILTVYANNPIGIALYKKFDFKEYGMLPKSILYKDELTDQMYMYKEMN